MIDYFRRAQLSLALLLLGTLVFSLSIPVSAQNISPLTQTLDRAPIIEWTNLLRQSIWDEGTSAPAAARIYGYAGVTIYESLIPGMPNNRSLAFQVNNMPELPYWDTAAVYDWLSTADGALSTVLKGLLYDASQETLSRFDALRQTHAEVRTAAVGEAVVNRSLDYGDQLGVALLDWISSDGFKGAHAAARSYALPTAADLGLTPESDYLYVQTNPDVPLAEPLFGTVRTLGVQDRYQCIVQNNLPFSTDENSAFYQQAYEVFQVGNTLTPEQRAIAEFWIDTPGQSSTPAGHWVSIANQVITQLDLPLDRAAMVYGMLGLVLEDSFITGFGIKYETLLIRPVTYINRFISQRWAPYLTTPQFPEYPSNHSVVSAAAADMLTNLVGIVPFTDHTNEDRLHEVRTYMTFEEAADEAAISRLYGGIHYRTSIENGKRIGRCIAAATLDRIVMLPVEQGE